MGEEMVGICAKQSVMRVDLIEVTYLAVDFGIAIILMSIYGFGCSSTWMDRISSDFREFF